MPFQFLRSCCSPRRYEFDSKTVFTWDACKWRSVRIIDTLLLFLLLLSWFACSAPLSLLMLMKSTIDSINRINVFWTLETASIVLGLLFQLIYQIFWSIHGWRKKSHCVEHVVMARNWPVPLKRNIFNSSKYNANPFKSNKILMTLGWLKMLWQWVDSFFSILPEIEKSMCVCGLPLRWSSWRLKIINKICQLEVTNYIVGIDNVFFCAANKTIEQNTMYYDTQ